MTVEEPSEAVAARPAEGLLPIDSGRGRVAVGGLAVAHFTHHVSNSLLTPLLPFIRDSFELSYTEAGVAVAAFSLSLGLSNAPMGLLADRFGLRVILVGGLVLMGVASITLSFAQAYWQLLVLLVAMGIISGTYHAPAAALIVRTFAERVRGAAMGLHTTGGHMSFFAAPIIAGYLAHESGTWRTPYLLFAFAPIVAGLVLWRVAPNVRPQRLGGGRFGALREIAAAGRRVGAVVGLSILFQVGFAAFLAFMTLYLVDQRGVAPGIAAALFALPQLAGVFGAPFGGWLSDRLGRRAVIVIGLGVLGPAILAFTLVPTELVAIPLVVIGAAGAVRMTVTEVLVAESAPPERRATVMGAYYLVSAEVGGLAAPGIGVLASVVGIGVAFGWVGIALTALSALTVLWARRL